jgi:hypothetical protein
MLIALPTLWAIFSLPNKKYHICLLLALTAIFVNSIYVYFSMTLPYIPPYDAIFTWKIADAITVDHTIRIMGEINGPNPLFNFSSYPGFQLLLAIIKMITGIDSVILIKIFPLVYVINPFLVFLISKEVFHSDQLSFLAAYLYIFTPMLQPAPSYSIFVIIFFLMFVLVFLKYQRLKENKILAIGLLSLFFISVTHHLTLYLTLGSIIFVFLLFPLDRFLNSNSTTQIKRTIKTLPISVLLFLPVGLIWSLSVAAPVTAEILFLIKEWIILRIPSTLFYQVTIMSYFPEIETWFIIISLVSVGLLGLFGFILYLKQRKVNTGFVLLLLFFGFVMLVILSGWFTSTTMRNLATRMIRFFFTLLAPLVGFSLFKLRFDGKKGRNKKIAAILILLCFTASTVDLINWEMFYFSHEEDSGQLSVARKYSGSLYSSLIFFNSSISKNSTAIGDVPIHDIGTGMFNLSIDYKNELFTNPAVINNANYIKELNANYIFVDYMQSIYRELPSYAIVADLVPASNLDNIVNNPELSSVYNNGIIIIMYSPS